MKVLFSLALLTMLMGCGGTDAEQPPKPGQIARTSITQSPAVVSIDANLLMDWAERNYPQHFPGTTANLSSPPYVYRFYPLTGNYLGVQGNRVFVLGPISNGQLQLVGKLSDFACQVSNVDCLSNAFGGRWTFVFDSDVSPTERMTYISELTQARSVLDAAYNTFVPDFNVYAYSDLDRMMEVYLQEYPSASAFNVEQIRSRGEGSIKTDLFQHTRNPEWVSLTPAVRFESAFAHTYGHLIHNTLGAGNTFAPAWLLEGFATYSQYLAAETVLGTPFATNRQKARLAGGSIRSLQSIEERAVMNENSTAGYALGFSAVDYLANVSPRGISHTLDFFRNLRQYDWRQAFLLAYGRTVEDFYSEFESWRVATRTPSIHGVVVNAAGSPMGNYNIYACLYRNGVGGPCQGPVTTKTNSDGEFSLMVIPGERYFLPINNTIGGNAGFLGFYSNTTATGLTTSANAVTTVSISDRDLTGLRITVP